MTIIANNISPRGLKQSLNGFLTSHGFHEASSTYFFGANARVPAAHPTRFDGAHSAAPISTNNVSVVALLEPLDNAIAAGTQPTGHLWNNYVQNRSRSD